MEVNQNQNTQSQPPVVHKYIKVNPNLPRLVREDDKKKEPYFKSLFVGRINRRNFFIGTLIASIAPLAGILIVSLNLLFFTPQGNTLKPVTNTTNTTNLVSSKLKPPSEYMIVSKIITPVVIVLVVGTMLYTVPLGISLGVRRLHDLDKSGKYMFFHLVPFGSIVLTFYLLLWSGRQGENTYGVPPLARISLNEDILKLPTFLHPEK